MRFLQLLAYSLTLLCLKADELQNCTVPSSLTSPTPKNIFLYDDCNYFQWLFNWNKCADEVGLEMTSRWRKESEEIIDDPVKTVYFKNNLEMMCRRKLNMSFEFPHPFCEECWLLFETNSDFMTKCGYDLSEATFRNLVKECYDKLTDLDDFMEFLDKLELMCHERGKGYFKKEWCGCNKCLLLEEPTEEIWQNCISCMSESERIAIRHECLEARNNTDDFQQFQDDLLDCCYCKTGHNVTFPKCGCFRRNLAVYFVVDGSDDVTDLEFQKELELVRKVISKFGDNIGLHRIRVGIIQEAEFYAQIELSICSDVDQSLVYNVTSTMKRHGGGEPDYAGITAACISMDDCLPPYMDNFVITLEGFSYQRRHEIYTCSYMLKYIKKVFPHTNGTDENEDEWNALANDILQILGCPVE